MANPSLALLLPKLGSLKENKRREFLKALDRGVPNGAVAFVDGSAIPSNWQPKNLSIIQFSHGKDIADILRTGLSASVSLGAEKIVTFQDYSVQNAAWFLPFMDSGNVIESRKRGFVEMLTVEISNFLNFNNVYNSFSMNRIYTKEAALAIKDSRLNGMAFLVEVSNILNSKGIKTVEIIRKDKKSQSKAIKPKDVFSSITKSFNKLTMFYSVFGFLAYFINITALYLSLSLGLFYPLAIFLGGEFSAVSNFIMNEKINFKNKGFTKSVYRLGKFNALAMIPLIFDVFIIGFIANYSNVIGHTLFTDLSLVSVVIMSGVFTFIITKLTWAKNNNTKIEV